MPEPSAPAAEALLVIDAQVAFLTGPAAVPGHGPLIESMAHLLAQARAAGAPIVFLQNDGATGASDAPFQPGWALHFEVRAQETVLRKTEDDGFAGTPLQPLLERLGVRHLAVCGLLSEMCVAATARTALALGYGVTLPHDAHATYDVPPGPGSAGVPAAMAARAAEWSLGDGVTACASARDVRFADAAGIRR